MFYSRQLEETLRTNFSNLSKTNIGTSELIGKED